MRFSVEKNDDAVTYNVVAKNSTRATFLHADLSQFLAISTKFNNGV